MHPRPVHRSILVFYRLRVFKVASIAKVLYQDWFGSSSQHQSRELLDIEAHAKYTLTH
jgi:hypothetical protein